MLDAGDLHKLYQECMPLFIALGDEVRLTIIDALSSAGLYDNQGTDVAEALDGYHPPVIPGMNVKEITQRTSLSRPAISHHLKILKDAGLVGICREGTANYYYLTIADCTEKISRLGIHLQELLHQKT